MSDKKTFHTWHSKHGIGDKVYLVTDLENLQRQIIAIQFNGGLVSYELACGVESTWHGEVEITTELPVDFGKKFG